MVKGNDFNDGSMYFRLHINIWSGTNSQGKPWKSNAEIKDAVNNGVVKGFLANTYFDGADYENPIKTFLDDRIYDYPIYGFQKVYYAYIKQNSIELEDNLFSYSSSGDELAFNCMQNIILN